jgi:hypothetical protein
MYSYMTFRGSALPRSSGDWLLLYWHILYYIPHAMGIVQLIIIIIFNNLRFILLILFCAVHKASLSKPGIDEVVKRNNAILGSLELVLKTQNSLFHTTKVRSK